MADLPDIPSSMERTLAAYSAAAAEEAQAEMVQEDASSPLKEDWRDNVNYQAIRTRQRRDLKAHSRLIKEAQELKEKGEMLPIQKIKESAERFQNRNPELKSKVLTALRLNLSGDDDVDSILKKVKDYFEDPSLMDEALEFLLQTTQGELAKKVQEARDQLNTRFGREIRAGYNIGAAAREASQKGLGDPTSLRDLYRDITGSPRDSNTLFQELSVRYAFKELKKVIDFLLHSIGSDLKTKGPSIPRGLLHNLLLETRALQAILGVYHFFRGRMSLIETLFKEAGLIVPPELTFEELAKLFMSLVQDRYPTPEKVLQGAKKLGIEDWIRAKIIAFSQLRDAIREVALNQVYRSVQHREETMAAIIAALEALEEDLEEFIEREEDPFDEDDEDEKNKEEDDF